MPLVLGLDVGGSKTHAVLADGSTVLADVLAGSANPSSVGVTEAASQLDAIFARLGQADIAAVCAGAAGVDTAEAERRFQQLLTDRAPGARVRVVHDAALILAAAELDAGIAVISGTGSVGWGRTGEGRVARAGGWGYLLGDEGSGYWVTRAAVRHALTLAEHSDAPDRLSRQLAAGCGLARPADLLDHYYTHPERRYWASLARIVFDLAAEQDPASTTIVDAAADALAALAIRVGTTLDITGPVVLAGGLAVNQPALQRAVRNRLHSHGITDVRVLDADPVRGAVTLAQTSLTPVRES